MPSVELDDQEWQNVLAMISLGPWRDANPLLMKIGSQLRLQQAQREPLVNKQATIPGGGIRIDSNGREIPNE